MAVDNELLVCTPTGDYSKSIESLGCTFISCTKLSRRGMNPIQDLKLFLFYLNLCSKLHPDLVLTYTIKPNVYGGIVCSWKHVPYIANITGLGTSIENGGLLSKISQTLYKIGLKNASCVFFQNDDNRRLFQSRHLIHGRTCLIPGSGVNLEKYNFETYPSDNEGIRFLFVGRIMKDKGIEELLAAMKSIMEGNNFVSLDIVGFCEEDYIEVLRDAETTGRVHYHGPQLEVHPYYENCHCVILPSYHEGMANVLLEASSMGRPVIATHIPGCKEAFDEGLTGFGCEVKSVDSLIEAINRFLSLPQTTRANMGYAARKKMENEFDRNIVISSYAKEIASIKP